MAQKVRRKHLELDEELVSWFEENYPDSSMPWIINLLLRELKRVSVHNTPLNFASMAAQSIKEQMDDGVIGNG